MPLVSLHDTRNQAFCDILISCSVRKDVSKVDLGKLRLAVTTQVLVTETFNDLVVTVKTSIHQKLFGDLWTLRKSVKMPFINTRWHQIVTRPSGVDLERNSSKQWAHENEREKGFHALSR